MGDQRLFVALDQARSEEQRQVLEEIIRAGGCPFCMENFFRYHKQPIIAETDNWLLTYNQWPYENVRVHLLVVCKHHLTTLAEVSTIPGASQELVDLLAQAERDYEMISGVAFARFGEMGYNGSSVDHFHAHILEGDYLQDGAEPVRVKMSDPKFARKNPTPKRSP